ncbi:glutamate receptor ionotropic, NMDA 1-like [Hydractinia symbiolongicarpus]|uniref:glutamate receptor ionotropic, NMDA 1-like n=1 Tax=Hydractinia symbiolongicarpus TaxID=13093 RepID=UPI0025519378|nr:glutamate receptor ionotropic, NMDA 1-like [Hydractinia symbiolongicarpus]
MAVDLLKLICNEWQINFELYIAEDGAFGALTNGTWNGIINEVYSGKADIGVQGITPTAERNKVVDFSEGYRYNYYFIIRRTALKKLSFFNYKFLEPLDALLLLMMVASSIILQVMLFLFENVTTRGLKIEKRFTWRDVLAYSTGLVFQRDIGGRNPISFYGRLSSLAFAVSMIVIMSTYTAKLTANEINNQESDGFLGITDPKILEPTTEFKFGTVKSTSIEGFFQHHPSTKFQRVYDFMKPYSVKNDEEGVKAVISGKIDAFIATTFVLPVTSKTEYCFKTKAFIDERYQTELAFAAQMKSPILKKVSLSILKYKENGEINRLYKKWCYQPVCKSFKEENARFGLGYFGGFAVFIAVSLLVCLAILGIEHVYSRNIATKRAQE